MKNIKLNIFGFILSNLFIVTPVLAETYHWQGFYLGATAGEVMAHFDAKTSAQPGSLFNSVQANQLNNAGNQAINTKGFISGLEAGYNWQQNSLLIGLEADLQTLSINGNTHTGAITLADVVHRHAVLSAYGSSNWLFTARPRIGYTTNNWLFYLTGGLVLGFIQNDFLFSDNARHFESKRIRQWQTGFDLGLGAEKKISRNVSVKAEYLFVNFADTNAYNMNNFVPAGQTFSNSGKLRFNIARLGINYHFDDQANLQYIPALFSASEWQTEIGTRLFLSSGIDGSPQPLLGDDVSLASRLIFSDLRALSGETFARADHVGGFFAKGNLGAGNITEGQLHDEDFPAGGAYSNTLSNVLGNLSYATVDLGYAFLKTPTSKTGVFIGYNYYAQNLNAYSCHQLAGATVCVPSGILSDFLGISQDDRFNSLRIGISSQFDLTDKLTLTSEAAYIPVVGYRGTDIHNAREFIGPERSNNGNGAMIESVLDYQFHPLWRVGLGARYWMWNMRSGSVSSDFLAPNSESGTQPGRYNSQRYGVFFQVSYHEQEKKNFLHWQTPVNWQGVFIGGHLGGGWGQTNWSDPYGATPATGSLVNVPGFGDYIQSTGPLGGANVNVNWQRGSYVYGIGGTISALDIRGENTLFSGLGGVNGQTIANYLTTVVAKLGIATNASLLYLNIGRAMLHVKYHVNANTGVLTLGSGNKTEDAWGWTGGVGLEYAITNHWTSTVEYDYISIPNHAISFPLSGALDRQLSLSQTMNIFKVGLNYRFDVLG